MTNRLTKLFDKKKKGVLNMYFTAGYPRLHSTIEVLQALQAAGADIVEIGIPYSDPIADGPVIQQSNMKALANGISISVLFDQLKDIRNSIEIPMILMGYLNPVMQFGFEAFCKRAAAVGVDGLILPDLPMYEFESTYQAVLEKYGLHFIFLVTPETSEERIRKIDELSSGFIYAVSSSSITGNDKGIDNQQLYFKHLQEMHLKNPILIGFGIKDRHTFNMACQYANGAIIGSAYIKSIDTAEDIAANTKVFLKDIR